MELGDSNYGINSALFDDKILILIYISIAICIVFIIIALLSLKLLNGIFMKVGRNISTSNVNNNINNNTNEGNVDSRAVLPNRGIIVHNHNQHHHIRNSIRVNPNLQTHHDYDFANDVCRLNNSPRNMQQNVRDDTSFNNNLIQETHLGGGSSSGSSQQYSSNQLTLSSTGSHNQYHHLHYYHYPHHQVPNLNIRYSNLQNNAINEFAV